MSGPYDPLRQSARRHPDAAALDDGRRILTYRELDRRVDEIAARLAALAARGARRSGGAPHASGSPDSSPRSGPGGADEAEARLAFVLEDRSHAALLLHAAPRAGLIACPLSARLTGAELATALSALEPLAVVCDGSTHARVRPAAGSARILTIEGQEGLLGALDGLDTTSRGDLRPFAADEVRCTIWTSGTGGRPRGVLLTGRNLQASAGAVRRRLDLGPGDTWLASLSVSHVGGVALVLRAAHVGSTLVVRGGFDPAVLSELAAAGRVTHVSLVPVMLRRLLEHRGDRPAPEALRCLLIGGARAPESLVERALDRGYPVALTYGMTETTSQVSTAPPDRVREKPGAAGAPLPGLEVRIADDGEIRVRGPTVAAGYLDRGRTPLDLDPGGWLQTGDLGHLDAGGDLHVTGRRTERIVTGGVTVDPHEVEDVLRAVAGVGDVAVVGTADPEWGERVTAVVVRTDPSLDAARLEERARDRLSGPKRPRRIRFVTSLPRTRTGKVDRTAIRALLEPLP